MVVGTVAAQIATSLAPPVVKIAVAAIVAPSVNLVAAAVVAKVVKALVAAVAVVAAVTTVEPTVERQLLSDEVKSVELDGRGVGSRPFRPAVCFLGVRVGK